MGCPPEWWATIVQKIWIYKGKSQIIWIKRISLKGTALWVHISGYDDEGNGLSRAESECGPAMKRRSQRRPGTSISDQVMKAAPIMAKVIMPNRRASAMITLGAATALASQRNAKIIGK
jgi:hypothetical protein